ncbi:ABC transporter substrate-binding protein [Nocardioides flavus (ex Wang et al. 2016)]|uniref:ABC transporter substrate-binding protein n=1 Tax=Nocardioides flavus (ex Wang et al. 2016) TaxID=2058780 RepID=A0ABQ3HNF1_9ACTN|nr:ABC transporter substrate-binding protein [Nocardioides flavus (ex Wang et al. 2016)]GHE19076.1 ABC transporter substrate-binding protein [Nocardioides flavus (ex Wang et al. 2016)]
MRGSRPLVVVACAVVLALAACSDEGTDQGWERPRPGAAYTVPAAVTVDPDRRGPAPEVEGATPGGTITVLMPGAPGPDTLDPTGGWSSTGNAIQQALVSRTLTQYVRGDDGRPVLVPDLATDLGRHNGDFTEWTFTIRDDATWEDGKPVTPEEVAFGICRSLDTATFPSGPGTEYSTQYFAGADDYPGPYSAGDPECDDYDGISVDDQDVTIAMDRPFPDMPHWGAVLAMGPAPLGEASDPVGYAQRPLATGPYEVERWAPAEELVLVRNDEWDPASDPGRHQYADRFVFRFDQDQAKVDEIMLSGIAASRTAVATSLGAGRYREATQVLGERLVQQATQCVSTITPDHTKITDVRVRRALAYAVPHEDVWVATGEVPGVTRVRASSLMPPGMPGRRDIAVDGEEITYDPDKARALLAEAGHATEPYPITMAYNQLDPAASAAQEQLTKGLEASGFEVRAIPVQQSIYSVWLDRDNEVDRALNVRGVSWCPMWPSGSALLPPLLRSGAPFNTARFADPTVDRAMDDIAGLPVEEQAAAWGELDEQILTDHFPIIPTSYQNRLLVFGERVGNPTGEGSMGAPNYKDLFVVR